MKSKDNMSNYMTFILQKIGEKRKKEYFDSSNKY